MGQLGISSIPQKFLFLLIIVFLILTDKGLVYGYVYNSNSTTWWTLDGRVCTETCDNFNGCHRECYESIVILGCLTALVILILAGWAWCCYCCRCCCFREDTIENQRTGGGLRGTTTTTSSASNRRRSSSRGNSKYGLDNGIVYSKSMKI